MSDEEVWQLWMQQSLDAPPVLTPWQQCVADAVLTGRGSVMAQPAHRLGMGAVMRVVEQWEQVHNDPVRRVVRDFLDVELGRR